VEVTDKFTKKKKIQFSFDLWPDQKAGRQKNRCKKNNFSLSINFLLLGKNILILDPLKHPNHIKCL